MTLRVYQPTAASPRRQTQVFRHIPIGLVVWHLENSGDLRSLRLVEVNPAAELEVGAPISDGIGKRIAEAFPRLLKTDLPEKYRQAIVTGKAQKLGQVRYHDARIKERTFSVSAFPLPDSCVGVAFENVTGRGQEEEEKTAALELLHRMTIALNDLSTIEEAGQACLDEVCSHAGWAVGHLFLLDEHSKTSFVPNGIWHLDSPKRFGRFRRATELYEQDLRNEVLARIRRTDAQQAGLKRSFGFSVLEGNKLLAILEFSSDKSIQPDERLMATVADIALQLGRVAERERSAGALKALSKRIQRQDEQLNTVSKKLAACASQYLPVLRMNLEKLNEGAQREGMEPTKELSESVDLVGGYMAEMRAVLSPPLRFQRRGLPGPQDDRSFL